MLQIIMLAVGVYYLYKLTQLSGAGFNLGLSPDLLFQWRSQRRQQYLWGIVAGWGSLVGSLVAFFAVTMMTRRCVGLPGYGELCASDDNAAFAWMIIVTLVVLIGGIALSLMARNKAMAIERHGAPYGYGVPAWGQPPAQPGWGQPPAQPGWGQPPAQPGWGQPPAQPPSVGEPADASSPKPPAQPPSVGEPADASSPKPPTAK